MPSTVISRTFDSIRSSAFPRFVKANFIDQITDEFPLLWFLMGIRQTDKPNLPRSRMGRKTFSGGESIRIPVTFRLNDTAVRLPSDFSTVDLNPQDNQTIGQLEWRQIAASIIMSFLELQQNAASETRIIDLMKERIAHARRSVMDLMSRDIFSDGTVAGQITGLQAAVSTTGTYAQIARATNAFWQAQTVDNAGAFVAATLNNMTDMIVAASIGTDQPDIGVMATDDWRSLMDLLDDNKRFLSDRADARFRFLDFQGVPMIWDRDIPAGLLYFLNSNHVYWAFLRGAEVDTTDFVDGTPNGSLSKVALIHMTGNLVVDEPRKTAVITGIT